MLTSKANFNASEFHDSIQYGSEFGIRSYVLGYKQDTKPLAPEGKTKLTGKLWSNLVTQYSERNITVDSDRLLAISGVAQHIQYLTDDEYLAGLWRSNLLFNLLWYSSGPLLTRH